MKNMNDVLNDLMKDFVTIGCSLFHANTYTDNLNKSNKLDRIEHEVSMFYDSIRNLYDSNIDENEKQELLEQYFHDFIEMKKKSYQFKIKW